MPVEPYDPNEYIDPEEAEARERQARREAYAAWCAKLYGSGDEMDWCKPAPLDDLDTQLAEHAAQIRNVARNVTSDVLSGSNNADKQIKFVGALTRLVQVNVAIAKVLGGHRADSKTVHGVPAAPEAQDVGSSA
jgi:hypothetical protein